MQLTRSGDVWMSWMSGPFDRCHGHKPDDAFSRRPVVDRVLEIHAAALAEIDALNSVFQSYWWWLRPSPRSGRVPMGGELRRAKRRICAGPMLTQARFARAMGISTRDDFVIVARAAHHYGL
jgi:hypothetical protein